MMTTAGQDPPRITWRVLAAAGCLFLATAFVRYLSLTGFSNDHYQYLAGAQQMLMGELPTRDFVDPGQPLMYTLSAAAQLLLGRTLLAEAVMTSLAFGLAAACVAIAGWQVSRSVAVGVIASAVSIAAFPRPYGYPKALLYAAVPLAISAWVRSPSHGRLVAPALLVAIAFLFRHDHGVYLGAAAIAAILLTPPTDRRTRQIRVSVFCGLVALMLVPYLAFVQSQQGLWQYAVSSLTFSAREADRTQLHFGMIERGSQAWLYYGVHALALVAAACVWLEYRRRSSDVPIAASLVVSAVLVNVNFLRDPLAARLPDVMVPAVLLGAWLTGRALRIQSVGARVAAGACLVLLWSGGMATVSEVSRAREHLHRTDLWVGVGQVPRLLSEKTAQLTARFSRQQLPDGRLIPLFPFFDYLERCSTDRHRLLVTGNAPEIYVFAQRPFAAGHSSFIPGYYESDADQQRLLARVERQVVAFTLVLSDQYDDWRRSFPELDTFVGARFRQLTEIPVDAERAVRVLVHTGLPPSRMDQTTGWPCFTRHDGGT
jgi:hypothetical protein